MAKDSTIEETKQTLVQRFRAWGGKYLSVPSSSNLSFPTAIDLDMYHSIWLTYRPVRKLIPAYFARLAHHRATCPPFPGLPHALHSCPPLHQLCQPPRLQD